MPGADTGTRASVVANGRLDKTVRLLRVVRPVIYELVETFCIVRDDERKYASCRATVFFASASDVTEI